MSFGNPGVDKFDHKTRAVFLCYNQRALDNNQNVINECRKTSNNTNKNRIRYNLGLQSNQNSFRNNLGSH